MLIEPPLLSQSLFWKFCTSHLVFLKISRKTTRAAFPEPFQTVSTAMNQ